MLERAIERLNGQLQHCIDKHMENPTDEVNNAYQREFNWLLSEVLTAQAVHEEIVKDLQLKIKSAKTNEKV